MFIALKPLEERGLSSDEVIGRLRPKLAKVPGAPTYLQAIQDLCGSVGASSAQYQYTLQSMDLAELNTLGAEGGGEIAGRFRRLWM